MPRPRFSIRDLFWLTLVICMALAWWIDRRRHHRNVVVEQFASYTDEVLVRHDEQFFVWKVTSAMLLPITDSREWDKDSKTATRTWMDDAPTDKNPPPSP